MQLALRPRLNKVRSFLSFLAWHLDYIIEQQLGLVGEGRELCRIPYLDGKSFHDQAWQRLVETWQAPLSDYDWR